MRHLIPTLAASIGLVLASILPASAYDTSVSGGIFTQKGGDTTAGIIVTQRLRSRSVHVSGLRTQISAQVPLATGGRYAVTAELRKSILGSTYIGAGAGIGKLDRNGKSGALYDILAGTRLMRHLYLEGRLNSEITAKVGHSAFLGVTYFL